VVKGSPTAAQEIFAYMVAKRLQICVPKTRIVEYCEPEWGQMKKKDFLSARK